MTAAPAHGERSVVAQLISKVPEVTIFFWVIKVLATTVGETAADFLDSNLNLGLSGTSIVMAVILAGVLVVQFRAERYVPWIYWLVVVLLSVVGTLITDNLVENVGVGLEVCAAAFAVALIAAFAVWYRQERTLSIHSINTPRREAFYWVAILFTFALGTAAGDLLAEKLDVGYWKSALIFGAAIAVVAIAHLRLRAPAIPAFWVAYILTRPLGASIGDYLSQDRDVGGLGLGTTATTLVFLGTILVIVIHLSRRQRANDVAIAATSGR